MTRHRIIKRQYTDIDGTIKSTAYFIQVRKWFKWRNLHIYYLMKTYGLGDKEGNRIGARDKAYYRHPLLKLHHESVAFMSIEDAKQYLDALYEETYFGVKIVGVLLSQSPQFRSLSKYLFVNASHIGWNGCCDTDEDLNALKLIINQNVVSIIECKM